jgi:glycosyltransferase involved in cell wall biosynthesis
MIDGGPAVSVVVPAFNAAATIEETLQSIAQQTYRNLDVIVVDDGSSDDTAMLVRRHGAHDPRFRVISQPNGGVASARNAGVRASRGEFIAFIDADDLWHPTKIAKQIAALLSGGPETALVYSPFRMIDSAGHVIGSPHKYGVNGWVLHRHFHTNLVGNGSALLIRKRVLEEFGGFDPWLRSQDAEGCEDLLLQLRIAEHYRFGEVSEYLVGYRRLPGNMSSNVDQMIRSGILAVSKALSECRVPGVSASAMLKRYEWQRLKTAVKEGRWHEGVRHMARQFSLSPGFAIAALWADSVVVAAKVGRAVGVRLGLPVGEPAPRHFYDFDPAAGIDFSQRTAMSRALRRLSRLDQQYRPNGTINSAQSSRGTFEEDSAGSALFTTLDPHKLDRSRTYQEG